MLDLSNIWPEWKAVELIGEGSFGKVYKCVREEYGMKFESAVKVISIPASRAEFDSVRLEGLSEEEVKSYFNDIVIDFANEIKLMFMLKGAANIVSVENYKIVERQGEVGWDIYILMEYLQSFASYSLDKVYTEYEVKDFALDIINALNICSQYKIIHRDIKPANIFIDRFGSFKLGDFGVARQLENSASMMSKKGTYSYMAPEVFKGEKYDYRADIYSLGMVMYKLLNRNKDPFIDPHKDFITYKDRNEAIERRRKGEKLPAPIDASPAMAEVILKACEYSPKDRYTSFVQFKDAVSKALAVKEEVTIVEEKTLRSPIFEIDTTPTSTAVTIKTPLGDEPTAFMEDSATVVMEDEPTVMMNGFGGEPTQRAPYAVPQVMGDEPTEFFDESKKSSKTKKSKKEKFKKRRINKERMPKNGDNRKPFNEAPKALKEVNLYYFVIGILLVLFTLVSFRSTYYISAASFFDLNYYYVYHSYSDWQCVLFILYDISLLAWAVFTTIRKRVLTLISSLTTLLLFIASRLLDLTASVNAFYIIRLKDIHFGRYWVESLNANGIFGYIDGFIPYQIFITIPLLIVLTALSIAVYVKHNKAEKEGKLSNYLPYAIKNEKGKIAGIVISAVVFIVPILFNSLTVF